MCILTCPTRIICIATDERVVSGKTPRGPGVRRREA